MSDLQKRVKEFLEEEQETLKHLQGQHNQKLHGNRFSKNHIYGEWESGKDKYKKIDILASEIRKRSKNDLSKIPKNGKIISTRILISSNKTKNNDLGLELVIGKHRVTPKGNGVYDVKDLSGLFHDSSMKYHEDGYFYGHD